MVSAPHLMTYCETVDFLGIHDQSFFSLLVVVPHVSVYEYICVFCGKCVLVYVGAHTWRTCLPPTLWCVYVVLGFMEGPYILPCVPRNQKMVLCFSSITHDFIPLRQGFLLNLEVG